MWNVQNNDLTILSLIGAFTPSEPLMYDILWMFGMSFANLALMNGQSSDLLALVPKDNINILQQTIWLLNGWNLNHIYFNEPLTGSSGHWWQY